MKAAIYLRVSTDRQRDEGLSLEMQRQKCEQRARADGAQGTIEVFEDGGFSGRKADNRPELQRLLGCLADFDAVYVFKLDRLARSVSDADKIMQACEEAGVRLVSLAENLDLGTPIGRAMAAITAVFARLESDYIRQRALDTHEEKRRLGRRIGHAPFGYKVPDVKGEPMQPVPEEVALVRELFRRYAQGDSLFSLVVWMNQVQEPRRGKQWYCQTVKQMLQNPAYIGMMQSKGKRLPAHHEAIVDDVTFEQVQQRLAENALVGPSARARSLSPVYRCGLCGGSITQHHFKNAEPIFGCYQRTVLPRDARHAPIYTKATRITFVTWRAIEYLLSDEAIADAQRRSRKADLPSAKRRALVKERAQIEADLAYNLEAARAGAVDVALLARENAPLNARREEIDRLLATEEEARERMEVLRKVTREEVVRIAQAADIEQQRRFIKRFFERVEIHKGFLRFVPTVPTVPPFDAALPEEGADPADYTFELDSSGVLKMSHPCSVRFNT